MPLIDGVFIRYKPDATPFKVEPDIRAKTKLLIKELRKNNDQNIAFKTLIKDFDDKYTMGVHPESTWFQAAKELFAKYERYDSQPIQEQTKEALIGLMELLCENSKKIDWDKIRTYILDNIQKLSPTYPGRFSDFDGHEVQRDENGTYYYYDGKQRVEIIGLKTAKEEEIEFYSGDAYNMYGRLYSVLRYIALFDVADEIINNPQDFPDRLCCQLFDNHAYDTGYLNWKWAMPIPYDYVPFQWHPRSPFSNPEWLASDLIMNLPHIHDTPDDQVNLSPTEAEFNTWKEAFKDFKWQLEIPVQSNVLIGDEKEAYFDFMGRNVRWINGNAFMQPIIVVPSNDEECNDAIEIARKFLSLLNVNLDVQLSERLISIQHPRYVPVFRDRRMPTFRGVTPDYALPQEDFEKYSLEKWAALAFNREASSASSIMYTFLNYYKIIELNKDENQTKNWIRENLNDIGEISASDWFKQLKNEEKDIADYIYRKGRVAIAHANYNFGSSERQIHNPDDPKDYKITQQLLPIVRHLAKKRLEELN
jgi:hypothetical protein